MAGGNQHEQELIERVVQEVLRRLLQQGVRVTPGTAAAGSDLRLNDKVVTLAQLNGRLEGVRRLSVGKRSVVTPSVKDELRHRGIELMRHS